MDLKLMVWL